MLEEELRLLQQEKNTFSPSLELPTNLIVRGKLTTTPCLQGVKLPQTLCYSGGALILREKQVPIRVGIREKSKLNGIFYDGKAEEELSLPDRLIEPETTQE